MGSQLERIYAVLVDREHHRSVFGNLTGLSRKGTGFIAFCPFHEDAWPTLIIAGDRPEYFCFACSARGDWMDFLMRCRGMDFEGALWSLSSSSGIDPQDTDESTWRAELQRALALEALMEAGVAALWSEPGRDALRSLVARGYATVEIRGMGLGYHPGHSDGYLDAPGGSVALVEGMPEGLVDIGDGPGVLIPYRDACGRLMGLVRKDMHSTGPGSYSVASSWAGMAKTPFLLHRSRFASEALVVEGLFDAMIVDQLRLMPVIGIGRDGLESGMIDKALLYGCGAFVLAPGGSPDRIGRAVEMASAMLERGLEVSVMPVPKGHADLDEFIRHACVDRFMGLMERRVRAETWLGGQDRPTD
jgi:hypothetical protein